MHIIRQYLSEYFKELKETKFLQKIFFSYLSVSFILFIVFSLLISKQISSHYQDNVITMNETRLTQAANTTNHVFSNIYNYTENLFMTDEHLLSILYGSKFDSSISIKKSILTAELDSFDNILDSYYLINMDAGYICSTNGTYFHFNDFPDQDIIEGMKQNRYNKKNSLFVPRTIPSDLETHPESTKNVISIIFSADNRHAFVVNIDQAKYISMINCSHNDDFQTIIINNNHLCLSNSDPTKFASDYSDSILLKVIHDTASDKHHAITKLDGSQYFISSLKDEYFGFTYIILTKKYLFNLNSPLVTGTFFYSLIFIILTVILSILLSRITYHPVQTQYHTLTKKITTYQQVSARNILQQYLQGRFDYAQFQSHTASLPLSLQGPSYIVSMINLDNVEQLLSENENIDLLRYAIININNELLDSHFIYEYNEMDRDKVVYVLNTHNFNRELLSQLFLQLQQHISDYFNITISVGISSYTPSQENLPDAFKQAYTALSHRLTTGRQSINYYDQLHFIAPDKQFYPSDAEKQILNSIKAVQEFHLEKYINCFFDAMDHYDDIHMLIHILRFNSAVEEMEFTYNIKSDMPMINIFSLSSLTITDLKSQFLERCIAIVNAIQTTREERSDKEILVSIVKDYIEAHIYDMDLSVATIAKEVHLSVNYLRSIFKNYTGTSLSGYITERKLELICHLLVETDMSIQEISDRLGFATKNYFFTFFKKHKGVTPTQYRNEFI